MTGVILAGGKSSRMGTDKGLLNWNGKILVEYAIETLQEVFDEVIINTNNELYHQFGKEIWPDEFLNIGPFGGILTCLQKSIHDQVFILACDMPYISSQLINYIVSCRNDGDIIIPQGNNGLEPLCGIYSKNLIPLMQKMLSEKNYKLHELINMADRFKIIQIDSSGLFSDDYLFLNINSIQDLS